MSVRIMSLVFTLDPERFKCLKKMVLLVLADHANDDGRSIYPSVARMAWKAGLDERTVQKYLSELREEDILEVVGQAGPNQPYEYQINVARLQEGCTTFTGGVNHIHPGGVPRSPKPSYEPSVEPNPSSIAAGAATEQEAWEPGEEDQDGPRYVDDPFDEEKGRPKWALANVNDKLLMRALSASGRKFFKRGEKTRWKTIRQQIIAGTMSEAWVESCIEYAASKQKMPFDHLLKWIGNTEKMVDWEQRRQGREGPRTQHGVSLTGED
jgi:hypothetical protein